MGKPSIRNIQPALESEYGEPLRVIVEGFADQGSTRADAAGAMDCSMNSLRTFCSAESIHFPTANERRRRGGYVEDEAEATRRQSISTTRRRRGRQYAAQGRTMSLTDWAERAGIPKQTLHKRINKLGLSMAQALAYARTRSTSI